MNKIYQIVLDGYEGSTDATDHLIKWVRSDMTLDKIKTEINKVYSDVVAVEIIDLPGDWEFGIDCELYDHKVFEEIKEIEK